MTGGYTVHVYSSYCQYYTSLYPNVHSGNTVPQQGTYIV